MRGSPRAYRAPPTASVTGLDSEGNAIGVLSTLAIAPLAGSNGVSDLASAIAWMAHGGPDASLVAGTEPFQPLL